MVQADGPCHLGMEERAGISPVHDQNKPNINKDLSQAHLGAQPSDYKDRTRAGGIFILMILNMPYFLMHTVLQSGHVPLFARRIGFILVSPFLILLEILFALCVEYEISYFVSDLLFSASNNVLFFDFLLYL